MPEADEHCDSCCDESEEEETEEDDGEREDSTVAFNASNRGKNCTRTSDRVMSATVGREDGEGTRRGREDEGSGRSTYELRTSLLLSPWLT